MKIPFCQSVSPGKPLFSADCSLLPPPIFYTSAFAIWFANVHCNSLPP
jgi:hypothetical protein